MIVILQLSVSFLYRICPLLGFQEFLDLIHAFHFLDLVDIKPENMEELTEVITAVQCHPQHCNIMIYSSSRGFIKVCDTRTSALCNSYAKVFYDPPNPQMNQNKTFINDILNSISDIRYDAFKLFFSMYLRLCIFLQLFC